MEYIFTDTLTEKQGEQIFALMCEADHDFVPALSSRNSTTQKGFSSESSAEKPYAYFETLKTQSTLLVLDEGNVVGFLSYLKKHTVKIAGITYDGVYLSTMIVDKKLRGKGIARGIYKALLDEYGKQVMTTRTWSTNERQIYLFEGYGFRETERIKDDRGPGVDTIYFVRQAD